MRRKIRIPQNLLFFNLLGFVCNKFLKYSKHSHKICFEIFDLKRSKNSIAKAERNLRITSKIPGWKIHNFIISSKRFPKTLSLTFKISTQLYHSCLLRSRSRTALICEQHRFPLSRIWMMSVFAIIPSSFPFTSHIITQLPSSSFNRV